ncbi:DUF4349 domain-containing protein [Petrocella sp. FN5]|uniref:DUF4349 domain-containing protein n=1 Tax=Petrocella sp. FN5 TaxID=3032002 RepID=UPI0023DB5C20|nr:DUF4349 domain-containing protein [Petrocella sp. FN5]MDF1618174.1 DUF4349 domain-containing protein [Petrocella sp. FN5]
MRRFKGLKLGIISVLVMVLVLSACGTQKSSMKEDSVTSSNESGFMDYGESAPAMSQEAREEAGIEMEMTVEESKSFDGGESVPESMVINERKIIKTGHMSIETLEYDETITSLKEYIGKYNAYVEGSESYGGQIYESGAQRRSSRYSIKVPAEQFEAMFEELKTLGQVLNANEGREDITSQFVDIESRLETLKVQEDRLLAILEKSEKLEDVIQLEYALQNVRYEIERYTSNLRNMSDSVRYSTIHVHIQEVLKPTIIEKEPITLGERVSQGIKNTLSDIKEGFEDFIVYVIANSPYLLFTALMIFIGIRIYKKSIKKSKTMKQIDAAKKDDDYSNL